jgi:hypothetical protein
LKGDETMTRIMPKLKGGFWRRAFAIGTFLGTFELMV